ncbi:protein of unknown function DUF1501 [Isosphaera pallida ATCC 43644]|uniref:DUF1501 domain-containing protein n=1 Tax=Isosphaera pallida (strain ATCC 43644 / DSM 9630 / IS1B) TaxID=575540 RepID=E8R0U4_ISOPI|nr:DUF1501 domain-containing protein [Isosphaera pallida]ADV62290.1 protein of unknown function DUF1501 [Isosphaera pallida ATCC 43644]
MTRPSKRRAYCDGISRRGFLQLGGLWTTAGYLGLADLFRIEARAAQAARETDRAQSGNRPRKQGLGHKAVINVFLGGGPPHQDMFDLKPEAPAEIRGEFKPIETNVPGIWIGECFPRLAKLMDKAVIIRSIVGAVDRHESFQCFTGWTPDNLRSIGGRPSLGAVVSKLNGPVDPAVPPFVGLAPKTGHAPWGDPGGVGFLGAAYAPFRPDGPAMTNMTLNGVTLDQWNDRRGLLASFDHMRRDLDADGTLTGVDAATQKAFEVLTSSRLLDALDLSKEDPAIIQRYGDGKPYNYQYDGAPTANDHLLIARRLIEAGVRCVTLSYGRWDSHGQNFDLVRDHGSKLDQALSALIEDLDQRGLLDDVAVIAWGEFGRTPRINNQAGRDHWPPVSCAFLAGGGLRGGQVIGSTNRLGEYAKDRPVHVQEVLATLYHVLGIDTTSTTLQDPTGRPQYLVEKPPIRELI